MTSGNAPVPVLVAVPVLPGTLVIVGSSELSVAVVDSSPEPKVDDEVRMLMSAVVVGSGEAVAVRVISVGTGDASTVLVIGKPVVVALVPRRNAMYSWGRPEG